VGDGEFTVPSQGFSGISAHCTITTLHHLHTTGFLGDPLLSGLHTSPFLTTATTPAHHTLILPTVGPYRGHTLPYYFFFFFFSALFLTYLPAHTNLPATLLCLHHLTALYLTACSLLHPHSLTCLLLLFACSTCTIPLTSPAFLLFFFSWVPAPHTSYHSFLFFLHCNTYHTLCSHFLPTSLPGTPRSFTLSLLLLLLLLLHSHLHCTAPSLSASCTHYSLYTLHATAPALHGFSTTWEVSLHHHTFYPHHCQGPPPGPTITVSPTTPPSRRPHLHLPATCTTACCLPTFYLSFPATLHCLLLSLPASGSPALLLHSAAPSHLPTTPAPPTCTPTTPLVAHRRTCYTLPLHFFTGYLPTGGSHSQVGEARRQEAVDSLGSPGMGGTVGAATTPGKMVVGWCLEQGPTPVPHRQADSTTHLPPGAGDLLTAHSIPASYYHSSHCYLPLPHYHLGLPAPGFPPH